MYLIQKNVSWSETGFFSALRKLIFPTYPKKFLSAKALHLYSGLYRPD
jgi:hypothetical protein